MAGRIVVANAVDIGHMANMGWGQVVFWIVVLLILAAASVFLVASRSGVRAAQNPYDRGLQVLSELYARGDIDDEEYLRRRKTIEG